jgi:hypothetical protein
MRKHSASGRTHAEVYYALGRLDRFRFPKDFPVAKKLTFNEAAALHWAQGALKAQSVPVGEHVLDSCRVTITCPKGAKVIRRQVLPPA